MNAPTGQQGQGIRPAWRWGLALLALILLAGVFAAFSGPKGPSVQTASVRRGELVVPVQCDGTLEPPPGGELRAGDPATVAQLYVENGNHVRAGAPLVRLENTELSRKALEARSEALRLDSERVAASADVSELEGKQNQEIGRASCRERV